MTEITGHQKWLLNVFADFDGRPRDVPESMTAEMDALAALGYVQPVPNRVRYYQITNAGIDLLRDR